MDNLRATIEVLFRDINPETVIRVFFSGGPTNLDDVIDQNMFVDAMEANNNRGKNKDELRAIYNHCINEWSKYSTDNPIYGKSKSMVFNVLAYFAKRILKEERDKPICRFTHLLRWRALSYPLGEDIFTTAFLANNDLETKRERHFFSWDPTISNDNYALKEMLKKGITDLHFHLNGSSLNFDLSWLSLMNHIDNRHYDFNKIRFYKSPDYIINTSDVRLSLYALAIKACVIRQILFNNLTKNNLDKPYKDYTKMVKSNDKSDQVLDNKDQYETLYSNILTASSEMELSVSLRDLQLENERLGYLYGRRYDGQIVDYAIRNNLSPQDLNKSSYLKVSLRENVG